MTHEPDEPEAEPDLTRLLRALGRGEAGALDRLTPLLLAQLTALARARLRSQRPDHTLQPTALVNEAYLKLFGSEQGFRDRAHFFAAASQVMRQVLVDHERARRRDKRGGAGLRQDLHTALLSSDSGPAPVEVDLLDLDQALSDLGELDARQARVVELRYFGGLEVEEVAEVLGVSRSTVERDWRAARSWLWRRLEKR
jgi:RNA polymerase sigma-70 factor (ECF subfamily)